MSKGERLKQLRDNISMSQTEAADRIGVSKQTLYKYEKDLITNIPSDIVEKISSLYNTTPAYIMGWEDENGNRTFHGQLIDIYVDANAQKEREERALTILSQIEALDPEEQAELFSFLRFLQTKSDPPRSN